jgi:hypothetical protein
MHRRQRRVSPVSDQTNARQLWADRLHVSSSSGGTLNKVGKSAVGDAGVAQLCVLAPAYHLEILSSRYRTRYDSVSNLKKSGVHMANKPGDTAENAGIYWCNVCKTPMQFKANETFPTCKNKCGRGHWEFVRAE